MATPHNSRLKTQTAYHAEIFRDIFQKCSPSHQGLPALFASSHKKFSGMLHHLELCGAAILFRFLPYKTHRARGLPVLAMPRALCVLRYFF
ncbi:hypothetical protein [Allofournierella massiliensis]|uniref:hypothetical protein n=1 Tax=Allofournierella massiliensis TaxID=1650663 RepID=UPI003569A03F